jgi:hypothetical protein
VGWPLRLVAKASDRVCGNALVSLCHERKKLKAALVTDTVFVLRDTVKCLVRDWSGLA